MGLGVERRVRGLVAAGRSLVLRVLDTVPPVRRSVDELLRVEFLDRTMVIAAQGLLALVPLVVVLAAFLPSELTALGVERFEAVTGVGQASADLVQDQVAGGAAVLDASTVRTQTGFLGLVLTLLSASSFARAVQRMYERVWGRTHVGGFRGRRLCLGWLLGWLLALQVLSLVGWFDEQADVVVLEPAWLLAKGVLATVVWWWTLHVLLAGRVAWWSLLFPAALTGAAVVAYSACSTVVMPRYATSSAEQFGTLGLVLSVATWLVGLAGVMVVAAVIGRVLVEDTSVRRLLGRVLTRSGRGAARDRTG
jgi:membrane protein